MKEAYIKTTPDDEEPMKIKKGKHNVGPAIGAAGLAFLLLLEIGNGRAENKNHNAASPKTAFGKYIYTTINEEVIKGFLPVFSFADNLETGGMMFLVSSQMNEVMPLYRFMEKSNMEDGQEEQMTMEMILKAEAEESHDDGETSETDGEMLQAMLDEENRAVREAESEEQLIQDNYVMNPAGSETIQNATTVQGTFIPHTQKLAQVDMAVLAEYETLVTNFYTIDNSTMIGSDQLDVEKLSKADMTISKEAQGPQILIYHTHSQEAFADSIPGDRETSIVGVGARLAQILSEQYGYQVLHHDASYDVPSRDDAYSVALPDIEKVLEENPQIQVVIDLHRDAMDENTRLVTELDGRPTARFMFFNGLSRTKKTGNISYLYNENLDSNLAFSFQLEKVAMEYYPGLTRKIYLKAYRYNMHLRPRNLLIELGAQNNTVEEAMNACDPLAHILDMVLSGQE